MHGTDEQCLLVPATKLSYVQLVSTASKAELILGRTSSIVVQLLAEQQLLDT